MTGETRRSPSRGRVVLVVRKFPKASETFVAYPFAALVDKGWDVHVVCSRRGDWSHFPELDRPELRRRVHVAPPTASRFGAALRAPWVLLRALASRPVASLRRLRGSPAEGRAPRPGMGARLRRFYLDSTIFRLDPDLVHFEFGTLAVGRESLCGSLGARCLVSFRGFDLNTAGLDDPHYYDEVWRTADAVHVLSDALRRRALERGCPESVPTVIIPPAIDPDRFRPPPRREAEGPLRVVSVGRLDWKKGYEYDLLALAELKRRGVDVRYVLVGDGAFRPAVAFAAYRLGLADCVELVGALPHAEVQRRLSEADVYLHLAVSEGFCNAVLEAQAMELPCVVSDAGGLPENVAHRETGIVVPRRDPLAAADALKRLATDGKLRREMGEAGRRRVTEHFHFDRQVDSLESLYLKVLQSAPGNIDRP